MTKYTDRTGEIKAHRVNSCGLPITDEPVPKFIIEGEPQDRPKLPWPKPKSKNPNVPTKIHVVPVLERYPEEPIRGLDAWDAWEAAMMLDSRMTYQQRTVLARIALHHNNQTGQCDPDNTSTGMRLGMGANPESGRRMVKKTLAAAEKFGWIRRRYRKGDTSQIDLTLPESVRELRRLQGELWREAQGEPLGVSSKRRGDNLSTQGGQFEHSGGTGESPEPGEPGNIEPGGRFAAEGMDGAEDEGLWESTEPSPSLNPLGEPLKRPSNGGPWERTETSPKPRVLGEPKSVFAWSTKEVIEHPRFPEFAAAQRENQSDEEFWRRWNAFVATQSAT